MDFLEHFLWPAILSAVGGILALLHWSRKKPNEWTLPEKTTPQFREERLKHDAEIEATIEERKKEPFDVKASEERLTAAKQRMDEWDRDDS